MKARKSAIIWLAAVVGLLLVGAAGVYAFSFGKCEKVTASGGVVSIPVSKVADGKAHYFRFEEGGKPIDFIVVKGSDGKYRTAFDACDACFREKKGYEQKGDVLVCKNCNKKFQIDRIGPHQVGGCNPSYLPSQVKGNNITFSVTDIKAGAKYF